MLQTFLFVAVPALVTLTVALYFLNRASAEEQKTHRPPPSRPHPGFGSGSDAATNRTRPSSRTHSNTSRGPAGSSTETSRRTGSSTASSTHKGECVVCFEEGNIVELYPCRHRGLCEDCATRIISWNRRTCPLCRARIQGFSNV